MRRHLRWPRWRIVLVVVVVALVGGCVAAWRLLREPGNISHPNLPGFTVPAPPKPRVAGSDEKFSWLNFGNDAARTHYLPAPASMRPPFSLGWTAHGNVLLEFPPVLDVLSLYELRNNGSLYAYSRRTGRLRFRRKLGRLAASSPAAGGGRVYALLLLGRGRARSGRVVALTERHGTIVWSRQLPSRAESSPLLYRGVLYFGSENGIVYALRARDGKLLWKFKASGAVKGGPAMADGKLYLGDYGGHVYALRISDGHLLWKVGTSGARFGLGSGNFYATPTVAFGRVFLGNTDGRVYAFSTANGKLAWAHQTGNYVYSSAAAANVPGIGPTVFAGSYNGRFYAFDARSGRVRWAHKAGGRISGSPVLVGDVVYYSYLPARSGKGHGGTAGLEARNGHVVFSFARGAFNPGVSDGKRFFLVGYASIYELTPKNAPPATVTKHRQVSHATSHPRATKHRASRHRRATRHPTRHKRRHKRR